MKLNYFKGPNRNFGDDPNVWLWPRLAAEIFDKNGDSGLFVGIGTFAAQAFSA